MWAISSLHDPQFVGVSHILLTLKRKLRRCGHPEHPKRSLIHQWSWNS